jgi:uncharacterized protein YjbI with pentapeptide repeats
MNTKQPLPDTFSRKLEQNVKHLRRFGSVLLSIVILLFFIWILWETYRAGNLGFHGKTFWDWMELLIIPLFVAVAIFLLNKSQKDTELLIAQNRHFEDQQAAEKKAALDRELAKDKQQQETLEAYFDRMTSLLLDKNLCKSLQGDEVRSIARTLTLTVLRGLDEARKSLVIQFLYESGLIRRNAIVDMSFADLRNVNLEYAKLDEISLPKTDLRGANLQSASLRGANFYYADLDEANLSWAKLTNADLRAGLSKANLAQAQLDGADLEGAKLPGASMLNASLVGTNLRHANFKYINELGGFGSANLLKAELFLADLTNADLTGAKVDSDQLRAARSRKGTIMPNGKDFEEWIEEPSLSDGDDNI